MGVNHTANSANGSEEPGPARTRVERESLTRFQYARNSLTRDAGIESADAEERNDDGHEIVLAVIGSMLAWLPIATVLPPWPSGDVIVDAGGTPPENATALAAAAPENPTALAAAAPENPTGLAGPAPESPTTSASRRPGRRASSSGWPPGPATQLARQRNWVSRSPSRESLTGTGVLADAWREDGFSSKVYEDPEETGVLVMAGFDPQTWEEPLGELDHGTRVRLHGVNAVAGRSW